MSFGEAIKSVFSKYAVFSGRARRSEYWYFFLFNFLVSIVLTILARINPQLIFLSYVYSLAALLPGLAVGVRRLHDIGKSGWYLFSPLFPYLLLVVIIIVAFYTGSEPSTMSWIIIGIFVLGVLALTIMLLVWLCTDSQPGINQYGPNPKDQIGKNSSTD